MDDRSCGAGGRAGEYRRLSEGEIPESVSSVSLSAAVPFVIGNMETSRSAGYLFSQIRGVARAFAGSSGVPGGEAVSRLCVETDDFEDRSRMKRFGGQVAIGLSDGNVQGVSGGCRRFRIRIPGCFRGKRNRRISYLRKWRSFRSAASSMRAVQVSSDFRRRQGDRLSDGRCACGRGR